MKRLEREVLFAETDGVEPRLSLRTDTRVDAGRWWRRTPLWLFVTDRDVIVMAVARRHYVERIPIADCRDSHYCHTTGELVIDANENQIFSRFAMSPANALRVLSELGLRNGKE